MPDYIHDTASLTASETSKPTARVSPSPAAAVIGSVVQLDGRGSSDANALDLTYEWRFVEVPIGSQVGLESFKNVEDDGSMVSFSPDIVGTYTLGLTVSNGTLSSDEVQTSVRVRSILVPHARGLVPDGKWIWSYIRDVWKEVEGREWFETLWSALIQISGAELLKAYQVDFNKSIRDIQDQFQRRWLAYEPKLDLTRADLSFYLGNIDAGGDGTTGQIRTGTTAIITAANEIIIVQGVVSPDVFGSEVTILTSSDAANLGAYTVQSLNSKKTGYRLSSTTPVPSPTADQVSTTVEIFFDFQSKTWTFDASLGFDYARSLSESSMPLDWLATRRSGAFTIPSLQRGDVVYIRSGLNAGIYRVTEVSGTSFVVDRAPPSSSSAALTTEGEIYRPVELSVPVTEGALTDTISVARTSPTGRTRRVDQLTPGRIVTIGDLAFTVLRTLVDTNQRIPLIVFSTDSTELPSGLRSQYWRAPHTLLSSSQNFEELGVRPGDKLIIEVAQKGTSKVLEMTCAVLGASGYTLGFTFDQEELVEGVTTDETSFLKEVMYEFGIPTVELDETGEYELSDRAAEIFNQAIQFSLFSNQQLTSSSVIQIADFEFYLRPKYLIRNSQVPVGDELRSIPALQEYVVQPTVVERDGKFYQVKGDGEYEIPGRPKVLLENQHYTISDETAFEGQLTFRTGSLFVDADDADFLDRSIRQGDTFTISSPVTLAGDYVIAKVHSANKIELAREIPLYALDEYVTATVTITRRDEGNFLRFIPGKFSATSPAPKRLWAEVSFFDNNQTVEDNFGILVGLKKEDIDALESSISYRQAVTGLMYSYTQGSAMDKVRLGAQILLGLPFAEHKGVIRAIDENYRVDVNGNATHGRILIEDIDSTGTGQGTMRVYIYPIDEESLTLAGIETNPETDETYVVGDTVELFAPLCKGVTLSDYKTEALADDASAKSLLQQYHSVIVRVNDSIFTTDEIDLVSTFLKRITPSYIATIIRATSEFVEELDIEDRITPILRVGDGILVDNISLGLSTPLIFGYRTLNSGVQLVSVEDGVYQLRRFGTDLQTVDGSATVSTAAAGLLDAKSNEAFESPLCRTTDSFWILDGINAGRYTIGSLADGAATLSDAPAEGFEAGTGQRFAVVRKVTGKIRSGTAALTATEALITVEAALRTDGVMPGDLVAVSGVKMPFKVLEVVETAGSWNKLRVSPTPAVTGNYAYEVWRRSLMPSPGEETYTVQGNSVRQLVSADNTLQALWEPGDEIQVQDGSLIRYKVVDPYNRILGAVIPTGSHTVKLCKRNQGTAIGPSSLENHNPGDSVETALYNTSADLVTNAASTNCVPTALTPIQLKARPGDFIQIMSGADSTVDVGYGAGVYPVVLTTATDLVLPVSLTATGSFPWKLIRRS